MPVSSAKHRLKLYPITRPVCAARCEDGRPCMAFSSIQCPHCQVVAYCSKICQSRHWPVHEVDCKMELDLTNLLEKSMKDTDTNTNQIGTSLWERSAATDLLNLDKNEGRYFDGTLSLLLTGTSAFRHMVYTVLKIPESAKPKLYVTLNPFHGASLFRDFFALHMLFARQHDPFLNAEAVIHLLYSAKLPRVLWDHIALVMGEHFENYSRGIDGDKAQKDGTVSAESDDSRLRMSWSNGNASFAAELHKMQWQMLRDVLTPPTEPVSAKRMSVMRGVDIERNCEPLSLCLARMSHARRIGLRKWREDGMLLPFGYPRDDYCIPNPLFFSGNGMFPPGVTAEPLSEWPMEFLGPICNVSVAQKDVYGKLFFYLRRLLVNFQWESRRFNISTMIISYDIPHLLRNFSDNTQFDRIQLAGLWDHHPAIVLVIAAKSLRHHDENPFAALLVDSNQTVTEHNEVIKNEVLEEGSKGLGPGNEVLDQYAPPRDQVQGCQLEAAIRRRLGLFMWRNWDRFAKRFLDNPHYFAFNLCIDQVKGDPNSIFKAEFLGMQYQEKNSITRRWPNRLVHSQKDTPSREAFETYIGWPVMSPQRWMEWKRLRDANPREWEIARDFVWKNSWADMCQVHKLTLGLREEVTALGGEFSSTSTAQDDKVREIDSLMKRLEKLKGDEADGQEGGQEGSHDGAAKKKRKASKQKKRRR